MVVAIVVWAFRDWWLSLLALLPTAIGLIWAAGSLAIARSELDLFALFAVVTFVGIGVDCGIPSRAALPRGRRCEGGDRRARWRP